MFHLVANLLTPKESFLLETASGGTPRWHDWFSDEVSCDTFVFGTLCEEPYLGTFGTYMSHKWFHLYVPSGTLVCRYGVPTMVHRWYNF